MAGDGDLIVFSLLDVIVRKGWCEVRDAAHLIVSLSGGDGDIAQCAPRHVGGHPAEQGWVVLGVHILLLLDTGRHRQGVHTRLPGNIKL